ncbi:minimal PKS acyl carrier protein [Streptomyces sp. TLI_235]|nr:acyl carrier protein [Streptomyces sp. TLI_235]PBC76533.1 minimal PKS acyl carrier protein [Streptomyces sp. TLI_235]
MTHVLTYDELAALIKGRAGISVDPIELERPGATFEEFGVDSLALLGIVGELENRHASPITPGAEMSKTPQDFLDAVNASAKTGA